MNAQTVLIAAAAAVGFYVVAKMATTAPRAAGCVRPQYRRIAAVGDSLTAGGHWARAASNYINLGTQGADALELDGRQNVYAEYRQFARGGWGANQIRRSVFPQALQYEPTDVVIMAGVNDMASGRSVESTFAALADMYETARRAGARVYAVPVLRWAGARASSGAAQAKTERLNGMIRAYASNYDAVFIDAQELGGRGALPDFADSGDGIHLSRAGQKRLGEIIGKAMDCV